mgnify:CR=1 FL=1
MITLILQFIMPIFIGIFGIFTVSLLYVAILLVIAKSK